MLKKDGSGLCMSKLTHDEIFLVNGQIINMIGLVLDAYDNDPVEILGELIKMLAMVYGLEINTTYQDE